MSVSDIERLDAAVARLAADDSVLRLSETEAERRYREALCGVRGIRMPEAAPHTVDNHGYFPIWVEADYQLSRDALYHRLREAQVYARRYFYPLISNMPMYRGLPSAQPSNLPVARRVASEILCLPIYPALREEQQQRVIDTIRASRC